MKRLLMCLAASAVAAVVSVTACSGPQAVVLGEVDAGRTVEMAVGQRLAVRLPSNATTGFQWVVADEGPLTRIGEPVYEEPQAGDVVGAGGTQVFTFEASAGGTGELRLEYRRTWEKDVPAEDTWDVLVTVE